MARRLAEIGLDSVEALAQATLEDIARVPGFGVARAAQIRESAGELLRGAPVEAPPAAGERAESEVTVTKNKEKIKKKDKSKKKKGKKGKEDKKNSKKTSKKKNKKKKRKKKDS